LKEKESVLCLTDSHHQWRENGSKSVLPFIKFHFEEPNSL
jgi:hypothetical protein